MLPALQLSGELDEVPLELLDRPPRGVEVGSRHGRSPCTAESPLEVKDSDRQVRDPVGDRCGRGWSLRRPREGDRRLDERALLLVPGPPGLGEISGEPSRGVGREPVIVNDATQALLELFRCLSDLQGQRRKELALLQLDVKAHGEALEELEPVADPRRRPAEREGDVRRALALVEEVAHKAGFLERTRCPPSGVPHEPLACRAPLVELEHEGWHLSPPERVDRLVAQESVHDLEDPVADRTDDEPTAETAGANAVHELEDACLVLEVRH
jgi:hypothetical protein